MAAPAPISFLDELRWRGLLHQCTDEAGLAAWLAGGKRRAYVGFDPTADSLTIGNLVPIMMLAHFQRAGHEPVVVMGGGTGLIGDPSGKSAERQLMTPDRVAANVEAQRGIFQRVWAGAGLSGEPPIHNNLDWLGKLSYLEALRDIGKHFSVNMMIQKDSVRERLHARDQGISYTEFSYMILQSYDFWHLFRRERVSIQMGGSDQWGNIVAGIDFIRRRMFDRSVFDRPEWRGEATVDELHIAKSEEAVAHATVFGLTAPLITKSDGGKFGKTESGAIWLSPHRTSPYAYYQFWRNADDADAVKFLKIFTLLSRERVEELAALHAANPGAAEAQKVLAREATAILHGPEEAAHAERAAQALFSGDITGLTGSVLEEALSSAPSSAHDPSLLAGDGLPIVDLLSQTTLVRSKSEARQLLASGAITLNGRSVDAACRITTADLLHGRLIALRRGKKAWHLTRWGA
jgi:tyrosyl-tRNA synthetase